MDYKEQVRQVVSNAKLGDLIEFRYPIKYSHWGVYDDDGHVIHFAVADEGHVASVFRGYLQNVFPMSGDLLLGETMVRRQLVADVNVPTGATVRITNDGHARRKCSDEAIRHRRDALLGKVFKYNLLSLNCEHFATFVRFGQAVCNQIQWMKNVECKKATEAFQNIVSAYTY